MGQKFREQKLLKWKQLRRFSQTLRSRPGYMMKRSSKQLRGRRKKELEVNSIRSEAHIAIDDVWTIYNDIPRKGCPPPEKVQSTRQVMYIVPTQSYVRGRPAQTGPVLQMQGLEILDWVTSSDSILVVVGHDPTVVPIVKSKLAAWAACIKAFNWQPLTPIVQPK